MDPLKPDENSGAVESSVINETSSARKPNLFEGSDMTINPELDKYAGDEFVPEK
jgi:hypothetical protein